MPVGVLVTVPLPVELTVSVNEGTGVNVAVAVGVAVAVFVAVGVAVAVFVAVGVGIAVRVLVGVGVGVNEGYGTNAAVTLWFEFMVTWHRPVPLQAPPQPLNVEPAAAVAVSVTTVRLVYLALHVGGQLMPVGVLVTVPPIVP